MTRADGLFERRAASAVRAALADTRVVVINGARQAGKSTLARLVIEQRSGVEVRYLDDAGVRAAAQSDPGAFVRFPGLLVIDEVQRVPELLLSIKHAVDRDPRPGRFLLTASARLFALGDIPDLLPGRTETVELWPLSQGEILGAPDGFVGGVFQHGPAVASSDLRRADYVDLALRGGYPEAVARPDTGRRARFFESYVSDLINRDVRQVSDIGRPADMRRLLNVVAAQMATLAVPTAVADRMQLPATTLRRYLDLLDLALRRPADPGVVDEPHDPRGRHTEADGHRLRPRRTSRGSERATAQPGRHRRRPPPGELRPGELGRQLTWTDEPIRLHHYRDRDGYEVHAVLEHAAGEVVAVEVKAAETVRSADFRAIRFWSAGSATGSWPGWSSTRASRRCRSGSACGRSRSRRCGPADRGAGPHCGRADPGAGIRPVRGPTAVP